jgi:hypothetical protein
VSPIYHFKDAGVLDYTLADITTADNQRKVDQMMAGAIELFGLSTAKHP